MSSDWRCPGTAGYLGVFFLAVCCASARAADGVLEINQACAQVGCFPGDTPGFPVTITGEAGASYLLTSNLDLSAADSATSGVQISGSYIILDLNGFSILGPNVCTGTGAALNCIFASGGHGVETVDPAYGVTVKNGTLRNMAGSGVLGVGLGHRFENLTARHNGLDGVGIDGFAIVSSVMAIENGQDGIDVDVSTIVENCVASGNKDDGVELDSHGALVRSTVARGNGQRGFNLFFNSSEFGTDNVSTSNGVADNCGGGICTPLKRFYLTTTTHNGAGAPSACGTGFGMASLWQIYDPSNLAYDYIRGANSDDSGSGPPFFQGWVRTGYQDNTGGGAGQVNCDAYTFAGAGVDGSVAGLPFIWPGTGTKTDPWSVGTESCDTARRVWCIED